MRPRIAIVAALLVLAAALVAFLSTGASTLAYENGRTVAVGAVVPRHGYVCESGQYVPKDATRLRVWVSTAHRRADPLDVVVRSGTTLVTRGHGPGGYRDQPVDIPIRRTRHDFFNTTVCISNPGSVGIAVMGDPVGRGQRRPLRAGDVLDVSQTSAVVTPRTPEPGPVVMRLEWHLPPTGSWWALAPRIAQRLSFAKASFVGSWTLWLIAALVLGMGVAAGWVVRREAGS